MKLPNIILYQIFLLYSMYIGGQFVIVDWPDGRQSAN